MFPKASRDQLMDSRNIQGFALIQVAFFFTIQPFLEKFTNLLLWIFFLRAKLFEVVPWYEQVFYLNVEKVGR